MIHGYNGENSKFRSNINDRQRKASHGGHETGSQPPDRPRDPSRAAPGNIRPSGRTPGGVFRTACDGGRWRAQPHPHATDPGNFLIFPGTPIPNFLENKNRAVGLLAPGLRIQLPSKMNARFTGEFPWPAVKIVHDGLPLLAIGTDTVIGDKPAYAFMTAPPPARIHAEKYSPKLSPASTAIGPSWRKP